MAHGEVMKRIMEVMQEHLDSMRSTSAQACMQLLREWEHSRERKAEGVVCEEIGGKSMLVERIVFVILNDEEDAEGKLGVCFGAAICYMGSGNATSY